MASIFGVGHEIPPLRFAPVGMTGGGLGMTKMGGVLVDFLLGMLFLC